MHVRLLRSVVINGRDVESGQTVNVSDGLADTLIAQGVAVAAEQAKALASPPMNKARMRPPVTK